MATVSTEIPSLTPSEVSSFVLKVDNTPVQDNFCINSIEVSNEVNKIPTAQIIVIDGNVSKQEFEASAGKTFIPGKVVEIGLGYDEIDQSIFKGVITKQEIKLLPNKSTQLIIEVKHPAYRMTLTRENQSYSNVSDSDVIKKILQEFNGNNTNGPKINLDISESSSSAQLTHDSLVQYYCTDWDFIVMRAEATCRLVFLEGDNLTVSEPNLSDECLTNFSFGDNVCEFNVELQGQTSYGEVITRSWDPEKREIIEKKIDSSTQPELGNLTLNDVAHSTGASTIKFQHSGNLKNEELQCWGDSIKMRSSLAKVMGSAKISGITEIIPGTTIGLEDFSPRYSGPNGFVAGVVHQLTGNSSFFTHVQIGYSNKTFAEKYDDISPKKASGLIPGVNGLTTGIVTQVSNESPQQDHRVKVRIPTIDPEKNSNSGSWARVGSMDAGKDRGLFFRPEVGDEVIVGFMDDDPRNPIVLGSLYSNNEEGTPPINADENNFQKGIFTKSGMKLSFDDESQNIALETPDTKLILSNTEDNSFQFEDANRNKITFGKDGITLESAKDIVFKATGDVTVQGVNIDQQANASFTAKGNSSSEISSGGQTTVKGSLVKIN